MFDQWFGNVVGFFNEIASFFPFIVDFLIDLQESFYQFCKYIAQAILDIESIVTYFPEFLGTAILSFFSLATALRIIGR